MRICPVTATSRCGPALVAPDHHGGTGSALLQALRALFYFDGGT